MSDWPQDEFSVRGDGPFMGAQDFRERDDQQAARELAEERAQRAIGILRLIYAAARSKLLDVELRDVTWLAGELGLDWRDVAKR